MDLDVALTVGRHPAHPRARPARVGPPARPPSSPSRSGCRGPRRARARRRRAACRTVARTDRCSSDGGLREEGEDAPAVVVDDDDPEIDVPGRQARRGRSSRGRRPDRRCRTTDVAPSSARPSAVDTTPSIPFAPAVGVGHGRSARRTTRGHGSASTTRPSARHRPAGAAATVSGDTRLGEFRLAGQRPPRSSRWAICVGRRPASVQPVGPRRVRGRSRRATSSIEHTARDVAVGVDHARPADLDDRRADGDALHWASTFELAGRPIRTITSGACAGDERSAASRIASAAPRRRRGGASPRSGRR